MHNCKVYARYFWLMNAAAVARPPVINMQLVVGSNQLAVAFEWVVRKLFGLHCIHSQYMGWPLTRDGRGWHASLIDDLLQVLVLAHRTLFVYGSIYIGHFSRRGIRERPLTFFASAHACCSLPTFVASRLSWPWPWTRGASVRGWRLTH